MMTRSTFLYILFILVAIAFFGTIDYIDYRCKYLDVYNGKVIEKIKIPPKNLPELAIGHTGRTFPLWKWIGIKYEDVTLGDSLVKIKGEASVHYYRKTTDGRFSEIELNFWE